MLVGGIKMMGELKDPTNDRHYQNRIEGKPQNTMFYKINNYQVTSFCVMDFEMDLTSKEP